MRLPPTDSSGGENSLHPLDESGGSDGTTTFVTEETSMTHESLATPASSSPQTSPSRVSETRSHRSSSPSSSSGSVINLASILGSNERELELVG